LAIEAAGVMADYDFTHSVCAHLATCSPEPAPVGWDHYPIEEAADPW
jgi:hypothetical protein